MSRGVFAGDTDYSRQSLDDMIGDIENWVKNIHSTQDFFKQTLQLLDESGYLEQHVPADFKILISRSIEILKTSIEELDEISHELAIEVRQDHVRRLYSLGLAANKMNRYYGIVWHQQFPNKEYGDVNFRLVEDLYSKGRDTLIDMMDLCNLSERLKDFVGKKAKSNIDLLELKPNLFGVGLNFNNIIKKIRRKR